MFRELASLYAPICLLYTSKKKIFNEKSNKRNFFTVYFKNITGIICSLSFLSPSFLINCNRKVSIQETFLIKFQTATITFYSTSNVSFPIISIKRREAVNRIEGEKNYKDKKDKSDSHFSPQFLKS